MSDPEEVKATPVNELAPASLFNVGDLMPAARENRRDTNRALKEAEAIVTIDEESAKECFYVLPRGGRKISGPSIGLAETLASTWGNLIVSCEDGEVFDEHVTIKGRIFDTQSGLGFEASVRRRILDRDGNRYNSDMITNTINAATSILYRNLVLRVIPRPCVRKVLKKARETAMGAGLTWPQRLEKLVEFWEKQGITKDVLLLHLEKRQIADIDFDDVDYLLGLDQQIKTGALTAKKAFTPKTKEAVAPPRAKKARGKATGKKTKAAEGEDTGKEEKAPEGTPEPSTEGDDVDPEDLPDFPNDDPDIPEDEKGLF